MSDQDRRRSTRVKFIAYAAMETSGRFANDQAFCVAVDVSRHGIGLRTGQPPVAGQGVLLRLGIGDEIHTLRAVAAHVTRRGPETYDVGLDWSATPAADLAFLDRYLRESVPQA